MGNLIWHPFTQEKTADSLIKIINGKGAYLFDEKGNAYLDLISSWWVNLHGHANKKIAKAIYKQAIKLEHVIFAGFTHDPAEQLCEKLKSLLSNKLNRFFFSDNGSTATEIAIKMAYQYWINQGINNRNKFLSFNGGYHGDTFGAMSVGNYEFHNIFKKLFFETYHIPFPATWDNDLNVEEKETISLNELQQCLEKNHKNIAALIIEPLIQGASGMRLCRIEYLQKVIDITRNYNILIIFDEVMTGFGRTGTMFAFEQVNRIPDFLCISKGITGGFLPLALTITTNNVYEAFLDDNFNKALAHGHSYTANPISCAAAITSIDILLKPKTQIAIKNINKCHIAGMKMLISNCPNIKFKRVLGTIAAFNIRNNDSTLQDLKKKFLKSGLIIRPLGESIYLIPPYCISIKDLELAYCKIRDILLIN